VEVIMKRFLSLFEDNGKIAENGFSNVSLAMNTLDLVKVESLVVNVTPLVLIP
jgi:hypothetical protein